jgi:hypothetical protein
LEKDKVEAKGFENVKSQVGYCGIWCGGCLGGNGAILGLTRRYEDLVKKGSLEMWVPKDFNFKEFMKGLASIQRMSLCAGCKKGGGDPSCTVRLCALKRNVINCGECSELLECRNFEKLERDYPRLKEDLKKTQSVGQEKMIAKWISELKVKWPHCTLFCEAAKK